MAASALAIGAAEEASGRSFEALSAKMNVHVPLPFILSQGEAAAELGLPLISGYAGVHFAGQRSGRCLADDR